MMVLFFIYVSVCMSEAERERYRQKEREKRLEIVKGRGRGREEEGGVKDRARERKWREGCSINKYVIIYVENLKELVKRKLLELINF